jgi:hypothetical protein
MMFVLRNILVLLVGAFLAIPTLCDEGGENNGGGGVWILPCCANICGVGSESESAPRATMHSASTASDVVMCTSSQMGVASATFVDDLSGVPVSLPVSGRIVTVSKLLLQALSASPTRSASIVLSDATQRGYVMRVLVKQDNSVKITVR